MSVKFKYLVGDFETTVFKNQTYTEVWASAIVELFTDDVKIFHSILDTWKYISELDGNICIYYHNLKFDGSFWIDFILNILKYKQAIDFDNEEQTAGHFQKDKDMRNGTFKYSISKLGQWYTIDIKNNDRIIQLRDSLKLLPFSVRSIGESFKTKHRKLDMEYTGYRYAGCIITPQEKEYIKNDVLVIKEALELMHSDGHNKLTIGSCCMSEYKNTIDKEDFKTFFPNLYDIDIPIKAQVSYQEKDITSIGQYIRKSYRGGWCYVVKGKENKIYSKGLTADVNSLYPSMMHSQSGNRYPIGKPEFWSGNYIPDKALKSNMYYFIRIKTRFYLKDGYLPFIQIKGNYLYKGTECLETSDVYDAVTRKYYKRYKNETGEHEAKVTLTLTMTDFELIKEHYNLVDFEILDGCYFYSIVGIFDEYINKYKKMKMESKGAKRSLAKLYLNNLYGKFATNTDSSFKVAYLKDDGSVGFYTIVQDEKEPAYIPIGSAITSYARNFTIRAAQKNYHGVNNHGFIYADTDSIHCDLEPEQVTGITVHDTEFCCWKLESYWDEAIFTRQKTYIEHVTHEDMKELTKDERYYNVRCAGMPEKCKNLFLESMKEHNEDFNKKLNETTEYNDEEKDFIKTQRSIKDFKVGLRVPSKLLPHRIKGGIILVPTTYEMR